MQTFSTVFKMVSTSVLAQLSTSGYSGRWQVMAQVPASVNRVRALHCAPECCGPLGSEPADETPLGIVLHVFYIQHMNKSSSVTHRDKRLRFIT